MPLRRVEIEFALPVELTQQEMRVLSLIASNAARRTETTDLVHWASGFGSKILWREPAEPDFDDSVLSITTSARERYDTEPFPSKFDHRVPLNCELVDAVRLANILLDQPNADPDDDLRLLSRQLLRRHEELATGIGGIK